MGIGENNATTRSFDDLLRSDLLPQLIALMKIFPGMTPFLPKLFQIRLILDANRVQGELRWRLKRRRDPANRSALHEAIDAGVVVLYAPEFLKNEIEKHYEDIAMSTNTSISDVEREWELFSHLLVFYIPKTIPDPGAMCPDVDDLPYIAAWKELNTQAIYTMDSHIAQMGAPVIAIAIDTTLREYARASTVQVAVMMGSSVSAVVGIEVLSAIYRLLVKCVASIKRLPPAVQLAIAGALIACVVHPRSRAKLRDAWGAARFSGLSPTLRDAIADFGIQFATVSQRAQKSYEGLRAVLPPVQKRPLLIHARSICLAAKIPLPLDELERRIRAGGYTSRSQTLRNYLRRVLRSDKSFAEVAPGKWTICSPSING